MEHSQNMQVQKLFVFISADRVCLTFYRPLCRVPCIRASSTSLGADSFSSARLVFQWLGYARMSLSL